MLTRKWFAYAALLFVAAGLLLGWSSKNSHVQGEEQPARKLPAIMLLDVVINQPEGTRGYRKPYVAIWIADKDNFPVRTLSLWVQSTGPGPRWIPNLRKWHQDDLLRQAVGGKNLVDGMSGATRTSGSYKVGWDGLDDDGKPLPLGEYTLNIEAVREHGTYQLSNAKFQHGTKPFKRTVPGKVEIKSVNIDYRGAGK
ncbi:MAG: DUF2271 domain-containing protein [Planctomycetaceae bacterium]|nr:DUF2271 domain-containing protein [Planctomycetaceae bacterium]